jgi:adenosylcobinamide kinase/adenosylcobinamide-phosphate guanylyltransferase
MTVAKIVLITGGGRSGKSSLAQRLVEGLPGPRLFVATATPFDGELEERVAKHRESRRDHWSSTVEAPLDLAGAIRGARDFPTVLVDCLTMWVGNLMWAAEQTKPATAPAAAPPERRGEVADGPGLQPAGGLTEAEVASACEEVIAACQEHEGTIVFVTNEVGLGIIPDNAAARLYRDLLGRCNQVMAGAADSVILMVSGLPLVLKSQETRDPFSPP